MEHTPAPATDLLEAMWASILHGAQNSLSLKEAYRRFAMGQDPNETEAEFEVRWEAEGRPYLRQMKAEEERWLAMTDAERDEVMEATSVRHGVQLTPAIKALTLEMRKGRVDLLRDV